jgi:type IV fimbrial biogenesis protein FimT
MLDHKTRGCAVLNANAKSGLRGFTLIEMMIAIVVMAILASVAMPYFRAMLLNAQIRNAAESIQNGLQRARAEAVIRGTPGGVTFALRPAVANDATSWDVTENTAPVKPIETRLSSEGSRDVIRTVFPAGAALVTFDSTGRPMANPGGSATLSTVSLNLPTTLLSDAESQDLNVTINFDGLVRMCDPNISAPSPRACY